MNNFIISTILALASRLDPYQVAETIYDILLRRLPTPVLERIAELVRKVDDLDLPGEEKFREVMTELKDPSSPLRAMIRVIPQRSLLIAIQTAYERFKAS
jgi:hypothetical protein